MKFVINCDTHYISFTGDKTGCTISVNETDTDELICSTEETLSDIDKLANWLKSNGE